MAILPKQWTRVDIPYYFVLFIALKNLCESFIIWCLLHFDKYYRNIKINITDNRHFTYVSLLGWLDYSLYLQRNKNRLYLTTIGVTVFGDPFPITHLKCINSNTWNEFTLNFKNLGLCLFVFIFVTNLDLNHIIVKLRSLHFSDKKLTNISKCDGEVFPYELEFISTSCKQKVVYIFFNSKYH